jgi:phage gp46-like protein
MASPAPDIRLVQDDRFLQERKATDDPRDPRHQYAVSIDWLLLGDGTLDEKQALATAVIVALGTDALAAKDDLLPDPDSTDRAGWWGDMDADIWDGWPIGCKLWLMKRAKIEGPESMRGATVVRVKQYISDAIQPFVDRRIATAFFVHAERVGKERIDALVKIYRGPEIEIELRYQIHWDGILPTDPMSEYYTR